MHKLQGLIFDLDGVITETAQWHYLAWKNEVAKIGIDYTLADNEPLKGLNRLDTLKAILKLKGVELPLLKMQEMAAAKNAAYLELLKANLSAQNILPGIEPALLAAKKRGLKLAIASSSKNAPLILEKLGLTTAFDFIVNAAEIVRGKPDPEIFLKAAAGLKLDVKACIGFEDAIAGVHAIKAAKIFAVAVTYQKTANDWSVADYQIATTAELNLDKIIAAFEKKL